MLSNGGFTFLDLYLENVVGRLGSVSSGLRFEGFGFEAERLYYRVYGRGSTILGLDNFLSF